MDLFDFLTSAPAAPAPEPEPAPAAPDPAPRPADGPVFTVAVRGTPAPQGSKKGFYNKNLKRVQVVDDNKETLKPWREAVRSDAVNAMTLPKPIDTAVVVDLVFTFHRPKSHYRSGRNAHLLRDGAPPRPEGKPDLDKLARSTGDALTDAGVLRDDSRIAEYGRLAKVWVGEDPDALDTPGVVIRIYTIGATA